VRGEARDLIGRVLDAEIAAFRVVSEITAPQEERMRSCAAQLARVLGDAFDGDAGATPERAADAAFKFVTLLRESRQ
jgi:hypothetical protein